MSPKKVAKKTANHKKAPEPVEKLAIQFHSQEFRHHSKNQLWYIGITLLLLAGLYGAIGAGNYLLGLVVIAAGLAIFRVAHLQPASKEIEISPRGISFGGQLLPYHHIRAFWLAEADGQTTAYLEQPNLSPVRHFVIPDDKADLVVAALSLELPLHDHKTEPIGDRLARLLRI